ncbi:transport and Golgi organization protein 1 homolog [Diceros bicornis minor]|uniref:transport and Golgi organization protein 1 homolog n=1 Tax=Diceros bicornis minor TaxID=77932 RepID=UPI0026F09AF2|nr:transport and Golgi organization protein 1 homolog [Diceros bicornis minor]
MTSVSARSHQPTTMAAANEPVPGEVSPLTEMHSGPIRKLRMKDRERVEKEEQLSVAEERLKLAEEETQNYRHQIDQMRQQVQQVEFTFRHQMAMYEKNAHDNWIKARIWEREIAEQSREAAHLKHRLEIMSKKRLPEGYRLHKPMSGRPGMQNPPQRDPGPGAAAVKNSSSGGKVSVEAGGPPPRAGPSGMPWGSGPPPLALHRWPVWPGPLPPPAPRGQSF